MEWWQGTHLIFVLFYTSAIWGQRILHLKMRNLVRKLFFILLLYRPGAMMKAWLTQKSHDCRERSIGTSWAHKFNDCIILLKSHVFRLHYWHSAIRLQSQQSDCNPSALQLDYTDWFELQNRTAILYCCGLHLDYTERKIQSLGNIWKVLAHGVHQAVRFTWVWLLQDYLKIASNCFGLLGLHLDC